MVLNPPLSTGVYPRPEHSLLRSISCWEISSEFFISLSLRASLYRLCLKTSPIGQYLAELCFYEKLWLLNCIFLLWCCEAVNQEHQAPVFLSGCSPWTDSATSNTPCPHLSGYASHPLTAGAGQEMQAGTPSRNTAHPCYLRETRHSGYLQNLSALQNSTSMPF